MYRAEDDEDLRIEIFHLKKKLSNINSENLLLKVKIRKLQNEIVKKDKEMDSILDPRKCTDIRKILYERSASFVMNMKEKNDELLDLLHEKDIIIRRLQNQLDVARLYSQLPTRKHFHCKCLDHGEFDNKIRQIQLKTPCNKSTNSNLEENGRKKKKSRSLSWTPELQEPGSTSTLMDDIKIPIIEENSEETTKENGIGDVKEQYKSLSREHLLSIIENLKNNQRYSPSSRQESSRKSSPESDLERIELLCESPHEEIQQLHLHFLDMISEVDHLKSTIAQLQNNQEKTENVLKKKDTNIEKLAQEIKNLKKPKPKTKSGKMCDNRPFSATDLVARIYSANNTNKICNKYEKEKRNNKSSCKNKKNRNTKLTTKDVMTQVEIEEADTPKSNQCIYVEKGSITITQKSVTSQTSLQKEFTYDDEVFEECEDESAATSNTSSGK